MRRAVLLHAASLFGSLLPMRAPALAVTDPEPVAAHRLCELCRGRKPSDWSTEERPAVDALVDELVAFGRQASWSSGALRGKWRLVYVQPGPQDVRYPGADRRLLFPDLPWNDKYQIVGLSYVINVRAQASHSGTYSQHSPSTGYPVAGVGRAPLPNSAHALREALERPGEPCAHVPPPKQRCAGWAAGGRAGRAVAGSARGRQHHRDVAEALPGRHRAGRPLRLDHHRRAREGQHGAPVRTAADSRRRLLRCAVRRPSHPHQPERRRWRCADGPCACHEFWGVPVNAGRSLVIPPNVSGK